MNSFKGDFLDWLLRYDAFNRGFPGAAAELAGRIAGMIDYFGDIEAEMIASRVIAAITDEFLERRTGAIALHSKLRRELALFSLGNLLAHSRSEALEIVKGYDPLRKEILISTRKGYGLESPFILRGTFAGLGFFAASETSGSSEFVVLNRYMDERWPQLKAAMQTVNDEQGRELYAWIADHEDLEADHAQFAFNSIELAVQFLKSDMERDIAFVEVERGVSNFFQMANEVLLSPLRRICPRCKHPVSLNTCACAGYGGH
ncbi:MAG: hypothetical protein AAB483_03770 [Patescibacteria group bacterium]